MKADKFIISLISIFLILVLLNIFLKPYLHKREVLRSVNSVCQSWVDGTFDKVYDKWDNIETSAPIYNLKDYKIVRQTFDTMHGRRHAEIIVVLKFDENNTFPSGKEWRFEFLNMENVGWKITSFKQIN